MWIHYVALCTRAGFALPSAVGGPGEPHPFGVALSFAFALVKACLS